MTTYKCYRMNRVVVFLHGFLGCPEDFDEVIASLPEFECRALTYPFEVPENVIVVGYSMGGRIALGLSQPKILISVHPGLQTLAEKNERRIQDQAWIELLRNNPFPEFLKAWYNQPLFDSIKKHPGFLRMIERRLKENPEKWAGILEKESLAQQMFYIPKNAVFLHGTLDTKYGKLYSDLKVDSKAIPQAGHAAHLENPEACAEAIKWAIGELNGNTCLHHSHRLQGV